MSTNYINVVAGIIFNGDRSQVLLSLRKPEQHQGNLWEFPGGKIEASESIADALRRELAEELDIQVISAGHYCQIEHVYTDKAVRLHFWQVNTFSGEPVGCEGQELKWFSIGKLADLAFPEANKPVVTRLLGR